MRKSLIMLALIGLLAVPTMADQTYTYDWTGDAVYLGSINEAVSAEKYTVFEHTGDGGGCMKITKESYGTGVANGFVAAIWGLSEGDEVTVSCWRYDFSSVMPYFALWAHYNDALDEAADARGQDMQVDDGNCYGDQRLGDQNGWEQYSHTWTIGAGHTGLVIDAQVYGSTMHYMLVDDLSITVPDHANVRTPDSVYLAGGSPTANEATSWSSVKSLFN